MQWKKYGSVEEDNMREKDINGVYINNAIGYCMCPQHQGALNRKIAYEHKCLAKKCKHLVKYDDASWKLKQSYKNRR